MDDFDETSGQVHEGIYNSYEFVATRRHLEMLEKQHLYEFPHDNALLQRILELRKRVAEMGKRKSTRRSWPKNWRELGSSYDSIIQRNLYQLYPAVTFKLREVEFFEDDTSNSDYMTDTFYALTDGNEGEYDAWKRNGGDLDDLMDRLGH